jgi:hypothetical protein
MFQQPSAKAGSKLRPSTEKTEKTPGVFLIELGRYREGIERNVKLVLFIKTYVHDCVEIKT